MSSAHPIESTLIRANARAWGIAMGLVLGVGLLAATLWLVAKGGDDAGSHLGRLGQVLPGYTVTVGGSFGGLAYGFVIGYALGRLLAPRQTITAEERSSERNKHLRLNAKGWSFALGGLLAVAVGGSTLALVLRGGENVGEMLGRLAIYFPGYTVTSAGAAIGALYAFALGWLLGRVIAAVYNVTVVRAEERVAAG